MPPRAQLARQRLHVRGLRGEAAGERQQRLARAGEQHAAAGAVEQAHAQLALERLDLRGERRLRQPEARRGAAEMPLLGDGEEVREAADEAQIHFARYGKPIAACGQSDWTKARVRRRKHPRQSSSKNPKLQQERGTRCSCTR